MSYYLGYDVGGTNTVCGLVDPRGQIIAYDKRKTEAHLGSAFMISNMVRMATTLMDTSGISPHDVTAAGVGVPGLVDPENGVVIFSGNLSWNNVPIGQLLQEQLHIPVFVDNDVRMYVYGESMIGAGKGHHHVLGVVIGTGIAVAIVNNGALYYGNRYMSGELGHVPVSNDGYVCGCGRKDCLETIVSATGIVNHARRMMEEGRASIMCEWLQKNGGIQAVDLSKAYDLGDPLAVDLMNQAGEQLGKALAFAVSLLSPDALIIGGGFAYAGDRLITPMKRALKKGILNDFWDQLTIKCAEHPEDAGVLGSALNAQSKVN
ncbi:ROK family protein [Sporolactobacillus laevolacticus]|uniref:ROK family protein n=1 Tax=Sporolactobacillus laevolacticus TaxID=33018 RepID=UPI0025B41143|nr:ROK family protein [Sporolactobacillus laevolacticus]MDN3954857.1 ROK family protein [Sporolactobacillus laevolacticus]